MPMRVIAKKRCRAMFVPPGKGERVTLDPELWMEPNLPYSVVNSSANRIGLIGVLASLTCLPLSAAWNPDANFTIPLPEASFPANFPSFMTIETAPSVNWVTEADIDVRQTPRGQRGS